MAHIAMVSQTLHKKKAEPLAISNIIPYSRVIRLVASNNQTLAAVVGEGKSCGVCAKRITSSCFAK